MLCKLFFFFSFSHIFLFWRINQFLAGKFLFSALKRFSHCCYCCFCLLIKYTKTHNARFWRAPCSCVFEKYQIFLLLLHQQKHSKQSQAPLSFSISQLPNDKVKRGDFVTGYTYARCLWLQQQQQCASQCGSHFSSVEYWANSQPLVHWWLVCHFVCPFIMVVLKLVLVALPPTTQHLQSSTYIPT